jgi:hypothetical protein
VLALVMGLLSPAACGLGHTPSGHDGRHAPSYAIDTAPTTPQLVVHVRVHGHMGRPGVGTRDPTLG